MSTSLVAVDRQAGDAPQALHGRQHDTRYRWCRAGVEVGAVAPELQRAAGGRRRLRAIEEQLVRRGGLRAEDLDEIVPRAPPGERQARRTGGIAERVWRAPCRRSSTRASCSPSIAQSSGSPCSGARPSDGRGDAAAGRVPLRVRLQRNAVPGHAGGTRDRSEPVFLRGSERGPGHQRRSRRRRRARAPPPIVAGASRSCSAWNSAIIQAVEIGGAVEHQPGVLVADRCRRLKRYQSTSSGLSMVRPA